MTFRDGCLPYHNLLLSIKKILASMVENIKFRGIETVVLVILIHKPEIKYTRNVWIGEITESSNIESMYYTITDQILDAGLGESSGNERHVTPTLHSFVETMMYHLDLLSNNLLPVGIVLTTGSGLKADISSILSEIARANMSFHMVVEVENANSKKAMKIPYHHVDINTFKVIVSSCRGTIDLIDPDIVKDHSQRIKKIHKSLFTKKVYDYPLFSFIPVADKECQLLEKYPVNIVNVELLMAMRLKEGFVLTQVSSPVNQSLAFNTITFTLEKRIKKSAVIVYDIKLRQEQKMSSSSSSSLRKSHPVPIINISRLNLTLHSSLELLDIFYTESLRLKASDENLVDLATKLNNARTTSSISPYEAKHIQEHDSIILSLNQCTAPTSFHQNLVVTTSTTNEPPFSRNSNTSRSHQALKKLVDDLTGVVASYFPSPHVVIMYITSPGTDDISTKSKIITTEICQQHRNFLTLFVSILTIDSKSSISYNDSSSAFSIFTTFKKVFNKLKLRTFSLQRNVYCMFSKVGNISFNSGRHAGENVSHEFSYVFHKLCKVLHSPFKENIHMIQEMIREYQQMKLELGFHIIREENDHFAKNLFALIKVNEGSVSESILHCEITYNNGVFKVIYKTEVLNSIFQWRLERSGANESFISSNPENLDVTGGNDRVCESERDFGIGQCIDGFLSLDEELFQFYSLLTTYFYYEDTVLRDKKMDVATFQQLQKYAHTECQYYRSFNSSELGIELIDRSFDALCTFHSMIPVDAQDHNLGCIFAMGYTSYEDMILLVSLSREPRPEENAESTWWCKFEVHAIVAPYWRSWVSEVANIKRQQIMIDDTDVMITSSVTLKRLKEKISSFFEYFDKVYRYSFVSVLFANHKFSSRTDRDALELEEEITFVEYSLEFMEKFSQEINISSVWDNRRALKTSESTVASISSSFEKIVMDNTEPVTESLNILYSAPDDYILAKFTLVCRSSEESSVEESFGIRSSSVGIQTAFKHAHRFVETLESQIMLKIEFFMPCDAEGNSLGFKSGSALQISSAGNNTTSMIETNLYDEYIEGTTKILNWIEVFIAKESLKCIEIEKLDKEGARLLQSSLNVIPESMNLEMYVHYFSNHHKKKRQINVFPLIFLIVPFISNRTLDFISAPNKGENSQVSSQHNLYDMTLSQMEREFEHRLHSSRVGDFFVTDNRRLSKVIERWKSLDKHCWVLLTVQHLSTTHDKLEDTYIVSALLNISLCTPSVSHHEQSMLLEMIAKEAKKSCHSINQYNLLQILHDRKVSSQYLMLIKSEVTEDIQLSQPKREADVNMPVIDDSQCDEKIYYIKDMFYPGCFSCDKVDKITCSIQEFYDSTGQITAQKVRDMVISGLISSFFHPFAITNSKERCFVFKVSSQMFFNISNSQTKYFCLIFLFVILLYLL